MKSRRTFTIVIALLNLYMLGAWTYAYNKYPVQLLRVTAFRRFFADLSLDLINMAIVALTIVSLVFVVGFKQKGLRYALLVIHLITLAFILWTNL